jgi:hypothetical protein
MLHSFSESALQDDLWQLVLGSLGSLQIGPICAGSLRAWIATAVGRMRLENRLSTTDLAIADLVRQHPGGGGMVPQTKCGIVERPQMDQRGSPSASWRTEVLRK